MNGKHEEDEKGDEYSSPSSKEFPGDEENFKKGESMQNESELAGLNQNQNPSSS